MGICGGDWDRVEDSITLPRLMALREYWRKVPPASVILAASHGFLGHMRTSGKAVGLSSSAAAKPIRGKELFEFISVHGGTIRG